MLNRTGSKSSASYDRLSVILSDMARFVLCHRFGGIYLDADTILLRDWEELWGWKGAFAYRWSRLENYNTAVLRMNKGSALGSFLFRTALKNGLDFHPMTVSRYTKDAYLEGLLLRLPDALFDAAWLNTENFQRDRPPQPYFTEYALVFLFNALTPDGPSSGSVISSRPHPPAARRPTHSASEASSAGRIHTTSTTSGKRPPLLGRHVLIYILGGNRSIQLATSPTSALNSRQARK